MKPDIAINKDPSAQINNTGDCDSQGWYTAAKAAFFTPDVDDGQFHLTAAQRLEVKNSYSDYYERLQKWALANGDVIAINGGGTDIILNLRQGGVSVEAIVKDSSLTIIIIAASLVSLTAIGGYFFIRRRKQD